VALPVALASALLKLIAAGALLALEAALPGLVASAEVGCLPEWAAAITCAVMMGSVIGQSSMPMVNDALKRVMMRQHARISVNPSAFRRDVRPIWPQLRAMNTVMKTVFVIFVLALLTIAGEIYSDTVLTSGQVAHVAVPDPVTIAVAHGTPREKLSHHGV
jgi:hypothetical protein